MPKAFLEIEAWAFQLDEGRLPATAHPADAARARQIADPVRRGRYERGRSALRCVLAARLETTPANITFEIALGGKPRVAGCEFSISHSGPWLVVIVSDTPVGVDIEARRHRKNTLKIAERFFSARDVISLRAAREPERGPAFLRQWVAKEAALKCEGVGLLHLHKSECLMNKSAIAGVRWDGRRFCIHEFVLADGAPGAVAWSGDGEARIRWRDPTEVNVS